MFSGQIRISYLDPLFTKIFIKILSCHVQMWFFHGGVVHSFVYKIAVLVFYIQWKFMKFYWLKVIAAATAVPMGHNALQKWRSFHLILSSSNLIRPQNGLHFWIPHIFPYNSYTGCCRFWTRFAVFFSVWSPSRVTIAFVQRFRQNSTKTTCLLFELNGVHFWEVSYTIKLQYAFWIL